MTLPCRSVLLILSQLLSVLLWAADDNRAAIGYSSDGVLHIATESGRILRTLEAKPPVGDFGISPDGRKVVFSPLGAEYGGPLYLMDVVSDKTELLVQDHYYVQGEVYSDPAFSPDGGKVIFAVHARAKGDLVEASGPFAIIDLRTRRVNVLPATTNIDGGVAFANDPIWSPDGKSILLNFESDAAITDATGRTLKMLSSIVPNSEGPWLHGLGWIGTGCVVYAIGSDQRNADRAPVRVLNLKTLRTLPANELLNLPAASVTGLTAFSMPIRVRTVAGTRVVEGAASSWRVPGRDPLHTVIRLVHQPSGQVPPGCR
jgi:dipeptidyl aminopeptidase/acylaminoacyl peptidase